MRTGNPRKIEAKRSAISLFAQTPFAIAASQNISLPGDSTSLEITSNTGTAGSTGAAGGNAYNVTTNANTTPEQNVINAPYEVSYPGTTNIIGGAGGNAGSGQIGGQGGNAISGNNFTANLLSKENVYITGGNGGAASGSLRGGDGGAGIKGNNLIIPQALRNDPRVTGGNGQNGGHAVDGNHITLGAMDFQAFYKGGDGSSTGNGGAGISGNNNTIKGNHGTFLGGTGKNGGNAIQGNNLSYTELSSAHVIGGNGSSTGNGGNAIFGRIILLACALHLHVAGMAKMVVMAFRATIYPSL